MTSPVMTVFELKPSRVRNIFICSGVVFCASSRIMNESFKVRPRMNARGAISMSPPFHELVRFFRFDHVVEGVVQRPQIRVDLFVQIAGQEPEFFAGLDRGPNEDDSAHLAPQERRNRRSHGKVRFSRACRADPEHNVILPDCLDVLALGLVFRRYGPFPA